MSRRRDPLDHPLRRTRLLRQAPHPAGTTRIAVVAAVWLALVTGSLAGDAVEIVEQHGRWESGYGATFFNIVGKLKNAGDKPLRFVRLKAELRSREGAVVAATDLYNSQAEGLSREDLAGSIEEKLARLKPKPIAPGASDSFRCSFLKEETPEFASHRLAVVELGR